MHVLISVIQESNGDMYCEANKTIWCEQEWTASAGASCCNVKKGASDKVAYVLTIKWQQKAGLGMWSSRQK